MEIIDLNGVPIEITDLQFAIVHADWFRSIKHMGGTLSGGSETHQGYWEDIYQKLIKLRDTQQD